MSTKTALQAFAFDSHAVRVVMKEDAPWFVAKDVCLCLGITNHRNATSKLDADEKDGVHIMDAIGRQQQTTVINESGLNGTNKGRYGEAHRAAVAPGIKKAA